MQVLHVLAFDALAGTELMVASLVLRADPAVVQQDLATLHAPGPIAARLGASGHAVRSLGGSGGLASAAWRLGRLLRSRRYDVVNAYGLKASVIARVLVRVLQRDAVFVCGVRAVHVTEVERVDSPKARIAAFLERLLSRLVDLYDANSRAAVELLAGLGIDRDRLVYIPNGLDLSQWAPREREPDGVPLILCGARFVPRKRHADLLDALARLREEGHELRAVLAGGGPLLEEMRRRASALGLDDCVELPGPLTTEELHARLASAAIACLASSFEGMPGALMEAMATGVPVVATDVGGTNELVVDGESGLLVPPYDPAALASALGGLLTDPERRARLGAGGRRRMEECFSLDTMVRAKERLYVDAVCSREAFSS